MAQIENDYDLFSGQYHNKKVLITGHSGFKGAWLTLWLKQMGAQVAGFSYMGPSTPFMFQALNLSEQVKNYEGDIRNVDVLAQAFDDFKPEVVFHLAAQPIVRLSYDQPKSTFDINVGGIINVMECVRLTPSIKSVVVITSDKCYENVNKAQGYVEADPLGGSDPYSASKGCAEIVAQSYYRSFFKNQGTTKLATARAGNVIGGGDWAQDRIVPDCIRAWQAGEEVVIRKPEATRPWQHVIEPLCGYLWVGALLLVQSEINGEAFNFGPHQESNKSVGELAGLLLNSLGAPKWKYVPLEGEKKEANLLHLNCQKASAILGWEPTLSFHETVAMTADWYQCYYQNPHEVMTFTSSQIAEYVSKARNHLKFNVHV